MKNVWIHRDKYSVMLVKKRVVHVMLGDSKKQ